MNFFQPRSANTSAPNKKLQEIEASRPWIEKYRPKSMDEIASQEQAVVVLKHALQSENLPHLLFYGPPGTGKTSTILALARELYGPSLLKTRVLELNASDDRGIQVVREKVKNFSRTTANQKVSGYPCPPYKIVVLDEADSMTKDAQSALRRTMETYSKTTRFCIICNYVSRIIDPITSRCAKFRFKSLPVEDLQARIDMICKEENVKLAPGAMEALFAACNGDLRRAIMILQIASNIPQGECITADVINETAGSVPESVTMTIVDAWKSNNHKQIENAVEAIMLQGYSAEFVLNQLHEHIVRSDDLNTLQKSQISEIMGETDFTLVSGADQHLQLLSLVLKIASIANNQEL
ncbi:hypothetical protein EC973_002824 [Apophysomyces ossiformis]|uniref:Replication factor C subunit 2 n=1 Tax=Apophysomyces ossiformis TaxID=679940 RepID=A0A8H7BNA9_9FUNG|nr:hypothetical protein EC973_002824 [Apophysomyces ossiformis]